MAGIFTSERFCCWIQSMDIASKEASALIRGRLSTIDDDARGGEIRKTQVSKFSEK